jgi:hypothetical protein
MRDGFLSAVTAFGSAASIEDLDSETALTEPGCIWCVRMQDGFVRAVSESRSSITPNSHVGWLSQSAVTVVENASIEEIGYLENQNHYCIV